MRLKDISVILGLTLLPLSVRASYDLDGSKWSGNGTVDYVFTSNLYNTSQTGYPVAGNCAFQSPWDADGNPITIGFNVDVSGITGGIIPYVAHLTGTLNPSSGALTANETRSGMHVSFTVNVPGLGNIPMVLTDDNVTINASVTGHDWCFINGQWRDTGVTMTSIPPSSGGVLKGYFDILFKPAWTVTLSNLNLVQTKCERPGVTVSGHLDLENYIPGPAGLPAEVWVRQGTTTETSTVSLAADGGYSVVTHIPGTVDVLAKVTHWLRAIDPGLSTNGGNVTGADMFLLNGDVDQSNMVNLIDLGQVLVEYGGSGDADLDGSGSVNLIDLSTVLLNFGQRGAQ